MILLRHTRPAIAEGICYGQSDLDLGPDFEAECAEVLAGLPQVACVISSPLGRCLRLARRIAQASGLVLEIDPRLVEMDFGTWERQAWSALPRADLDAWAADFHGARVHGGESVAMLAARVGAALDAAAHTTPPALWVTHAGVVRAAAAHMTLAHGWDTRLAFGAWIDLREPNI